MQKVKRSSGLLRMLSVIVLSMSVLFASGVPMLQAQTNSAANSVPSATPVTPDDGLRAACAEVVEELRAARKLLASQGIQIEKQNELLLLESKVSFGLKNLRELDAEEKTQLRNAVAAAMRETAAIKAANEVLKKNQVTFWKKFKWMVIGGAAGIIAGSVLINK